MADAPAPSITAFTLTIDRAEVNVNGTWETVSNRTQTFNLLAFAKVPTDLGSANLPAGTYTQVRLFPTVATVTDATGVHIVKIPSGSQTGIKLNVDLTIGPNQVTTILMDFNVNQSLHQLGNGSYQLKPVIPVVVEVLSGTVTGTVTDGTNPLPGTVVTATYTAGTNYALGTVVNTGTSLADGSFKIWALLPGTYTLKLSYTPTSGPVKTATIAGVVVKADQNTDVGSVTLI